MKQTIDINGMIIVIETTEETIKVTAEKEGEIVEEFTVDITEEGQGQSQEETQEEGQSQEETQEIEGQEEVQDFGGDEFEEEAQLESFSAYIARKSKK